MKNYKDTLLMPFTNLDMKANLNLKEPLIQDKWIKEKIYEKILTKNINNNKYILHDGPPYANGNIHAGHALNKILKDIIVRYKNMNGLYSPFIPGWDTHGLPIENAINKIDANYENSCISVNDKRELCKKYALQQVQNQKKQFLRLGMLSNFEDKYLTLDNSFEVDELKLFNKMVEKKLVFQDFKPVYWSWSSKSSLAEAEIEYQEATSPSVYVSFNICSSNNIFDRNTYLLIWTTTPWTLPSNKAIAVNPNILYSIIQIEDKKIIIAKNLIEKVMVDLKIEEYKELDSFNGSLLENMEYKHPFIDERMRIILADYVSSEDGTGLVHNAPGFGLDDYYACKKYDIDVYCPIDDNGCFNSSINDDELNGLFYLDSNKIICDRLKNTNDLYGFKFLKHSVAHDWRTKKPLMYRATKQWFVNVGLIQDDILRTLENDVLSSNDKTIERIKNMVTSRKEWCISRQRVWGMPIPIIFDKLNNPIMDNELIKNIINIIEKEGTNVWFEKDVEYFLTEKYKTDSGFRKEQDIIDVWFDSGSSFSILKNRENLIRADLYLEGSDQFRGWFNSSLINSTILNNVAPYKMLVQHGFVLDEKGHKMSKSIGNVVDTNQICETYGADILRLWVASSDYTNDLRIGDSIIKQTSEMYRKIRNTLFRYVVSNLNDFNPRTQIQEVLRIEDYYILSEMNKKIEEINKSYEKFDFLNVIKIINNFTVELSQWYFDIIKDSLYCEEANSLVRKQIQTTLYMLLKNFLILLTPIIPHTCEEIYSEFNKLNKKISVNLENWVFPSNLKLDDNWDNKFKEFFILKDNVYIKLEEQRKNGVIRKNNEAVVYLNKNNSFDELTLARWLNVSKVKINNNLNDEIVIKKEETYKCERCWNYFDKDKYIESEEICVRCMNVISKK